MAENNEQHQTNDNTAGITAQILSWTEDMRQHEAVSWERMPEIDLYMDQVITYLDKQLHLFQRSENNKLLTSSMINNYVKDGLLPRPDHKKYSRDHLASLVVICMLKQVLSIPDVASLFHGLQESTETAALYDRFCSLQKEALSEVCDRTESAAQEDEDALRNLALTLSIEANARRIAAERILSNFTQDKK